MNLLPNCPKHGKIAKFAGLDHLGRQVFKCWCGNRVTSTTSTIGMTANPDAAGPDVRILDGKLPS